MTIKLKLTTLPRSNFLLGYMPALAYMTRCSAEQDLPHCNDGLPVTVETEQGRLGPPSPYDDGRQNRKPHLSG